MRSLSNPSAFGAETGGAAGANVSDIAQLSINTIRTLSMDGVEKADSAIRERRWRWLLSCIRSGRMT